MKFEMSVGNTSENNRYLAVGVRSVDLRTDTRVGKIWKLPSHRKRSAGSQFKRTLGQFLGNCTIEKLGKESKSPNNMENKSQRVERTLEKNYFTEV